MAFTGINGDDRLVEMTSATHDLLRPSVRLQQIELTAPCAKERQS